MLGLRCCAWACSSCSEWGLFSSGGARASPCSVFSLQSSRHTGSVVMVPGLCCPTACGTGEGNGNPLQCSCLENPRDGGAWWAAIYGVAQSQTQLKRLSSSSRRMWNLPGLGIEPESSVSAGGFLTTRPPTKSRTHFWCHFSQTVLPNFQVGLNGFSPSMPQVYPKVSLVSHIWNHSESDLCVL